ncbi:hypothetical protein D3C75_967670 [compost metagenome]
MVAEENPDMGGGIGAGCQMVRTLRLRQQAAELRGSCKTGHQLPPGRAFQQLKTIAPRPCRVRIAGKHMGI